MLRLGRSVREGDVSPALPGLSRPSSILNAPIGVTLSASRGRAKKRRMATINFVNFVNFRRCGSGRMAALTFGAFCPRAHALRPDHKPLASHLAACYRTAMPTVPDEFDQVIDAPFDDALSQRYLVYALSTITARSLPDVRDGLKPVHRRLLWAMRLLRLDPGTRLQEMRARRRRHDRQISSARRPVGL